MNHFLHEMYINITKVLSSGHFKIFYLGYFQTNIRIFMTFISLYWGFCKGSNISYTFVFYTECWKNFGWGLAKDIFPIFLKNAVCLFRFSNYYSHRFFPRPNLDKKNVTAQFKTITFSSSLEITWILHLHYMIILHIPQPYSERI